MDREFMARLGIFADNPGVYCGEWRAGGGEPLVSFNPASGEAIAEVSTATRPQYEETLRVAQQAFLTWRRVPAPQRGEVVRQIGLALRESREDLWRLVSLEVGKILPEGVGEVQEMIDMCDFSTGLSRQLYGLTMPSERPEHRLMEQWHPLGVTGVITAFNFPVAVWAWNAAVAAVCGNPVVWKPSPLAPLTAIAVHKIIESVMREHGHPGVFSLCIGASREVGEWMAEDRRIPLVSATGSCEMGRNVGQTVASRLGRCLLELGGNNAAIITESADLDLALRAVVFSAVGTAGQRCTTLRRLFVHESILESFSQRLIQAYQSITIGDPLAEGTLMGPLIQEQAVARMMRALEEAKSQGATCLTGGARLDRNGHFVTPAIVRAEPGLPVARQETFAPILYLFPYQNLEEALCWQNNVEQGLSSSLFTEQYRDAERFLSHDGSDCGIANVNIGTSGAEIGGAFGGEKDTGGGREAGSDSWKAYMRRQTCTLNFGRDLPLAQGIKFDVPE